MRKRNKIKNIALIAHDNKKDEMVDWAKTHIKELDGMFYAERDGRWQGSRLFLREFF